MEGPPGPLEKFPTDIENLSDQDAGLVLISLIEKFNPGITFGELFSGQFALPGQNAMAGIFGDFGRWVGQGTSDFVSKTGDVMGDAIRLITDKPVREGIIDFSAMASGLPPPSGLKDLLGGQSGLQNILSSMFGQAGQSAKQAQGIPTQFIWIGAAAVGFLMLIMLLK